MEATTQTKSTTTVRPAVYVGKYSNSQYSEALNGVREDLKGRILKGIQAINGRTQKAIDRITSVEDVNGITLDMLDLVPKSNTKYSTWTLDKKKAYLVKRAAAAGAKEVDAYVERACYLAQLDSVVDFIRVNVEYTRSRVWGMCPKATAYFDLSNDCVMHESSRITGCGYDKGSTAIAEALNKCDAFLKLLLNADKEIAVLHSLEDGYIPRLAGGCGVDSHMQLLYDLGYSMQHIAWGSTFDCYVITRK